MRISSTLATLWTLLCLSLFSYYANIESIEYLERPMVTNAELDFEAEVSAIAVCFWLPLIIRLTNLSSLIFPNHTEQDREAMRENHLYDKYTADFILNNTARVASFLHPIQGTYNEVEFLKGGYRCAEYTNNEVRREKKSVVLNILTKSIYEPRTYFNIYAYQRTKKPRDFRLIDDHVRRPLHEYTTIQKIIVKRLPAPFATKCLKYTEETRQSQLNTARDVKIIENRNHCYEQCLYTQYNNTTPKEFLATEGRIITGDYEYSTYCDKKCRLPDCYEEVFRVISNTYVTRNLIKTTFTFNELRPVLSLQYVPSRTWIQFIVNIAGLANTLLGYAVCDITNLFILLAYIQGLKTILPRLQNKRMLKKLASKFILLLSILGCLWQVSLITVNYLHYNSSSELYIGKTNHKEIPVYTICFPMMLLLRPLYKNMEYERFQHYNFLNITSMTFQVEDIFESTYLVVGYLLPKINTLTLVNDLRFTTHYVNNFKCFQINLKYNHLATTQYELLFAYANKTFDDIQYNVILGVDRMIPFDFKFDENIYGLGRREELYYTYNRVKLLPYPYKTNCYAHPTYSRELCLDKCLQRLSHSVLVDVNSTLTPYDYNDKYFKRREICRKRCSVFNCNFVIFNAIKDNTKAGSAIALQKAEKETIFTLLPSITLVEFILHLTSFLSFWLGVSLVTSFRVIPYMQRYLDSNYPSNIAANISSIVKRNVVLINTTRILILSPLLTGLIYHLRDVIELYLQYEMQTSTSVAVGGYFNPPAISFCFYFSAVTLSKGRKPDSCKSTACLDNTTKIFNDIFDALQIHNTHDNTLRIVRAESAEYTAYAADNYYNPGMKCFRIRHFTKGKHLHALNIRRASHSTERSVLSFNYTTAMNLYNPLCKITIHDELDMPRYPRGHGSFWSSSRYRLQYTTTITKFLRYPFATNCHDYSLNGFTSRYDCIDQCSQNEFLSRYGHISTEIERTTKTHVTQPYKSFSPEQFENVTQMCQKQCAMKDCYTEMYERIEMEDFDYGRPLQFSLAETSTITQSLYVAKFKFFAFVIYIFGLLGLWLGLDALTFPSLMKSLFNKTNRAKRSRGAKRRRRAKRSHGTERHRRSVA